MQENKIIYIVTLFGKSVKTSLPPSPSINQGNLENAHEFVLLSMYQNVA
jgi:hypothetical protein